MYSPKNFNYIFATSAQILEPSCHNSILNANEDFQFHLGMPPETVKNAWNGLKGKGPPESTPSVAPPVAPLDTRKYTAGFPFKAEKDLPAPSYGLNLVSENRKNRGKEPQYGHPKPVLRSVVSPLNARRLKPIRQKTKNAVVCIIF